MPQRKPLRTEPVPGTSPCQVKYHMAQAAATVNCARPMKNAFTHSSAKQLYRKKYLVSLVQVTVDTTVMSSRGFSSPMEKSHSAPKHQKATHTAIISTKANGTKKTEQFYLMNRAVVLYIAIPSRILEHMHKISSTNRPAAAHIP